MEAASRPPRGLASGQASVWYFPRFGIGNNGSRSQSDAPGPPLPPRVHVAHARCAGQPWRGRCRALKRLLRRVHVRKDGCEVWVGNQLLGRAQPAAAKTAGLPLDKVVVHNHLIGGGFGRGLEVDGVIRAVEIAKHVDGPVKVVWTPECRANQLRYLPNPAHQRSSGHRGPHRPEFATAGRNGRGWYFGHCSCHRQRDLCRNGQAFAKAAGRHCCIEAVGVSQTRSRRAGS
jgi:hypothetical protein